MDKNKKQAFHLRELEKSFPYAQAVKVGKTLYLSGSVSWDQDGQVVAAGDMKAQMRNAYEDIRKTLDAHGATFENIVKETLYTTDIDAAVEAAGVRRQFYGDSTPPAATVGRPTATARARTSTGRNLQAIRSSTSRRTGY